MSYLTARSSRFKRALKQYRREDLVAIRIKTTLATLAITPFSRALRTHKVIHPSLGRVYSSRVTGDIRVIWAMQENNIVMLLDIGGHSGGNKVYKQLVR